MSFIETINVGAGAPGAGGSGPQSFPETAASPNPFPTESTGSATLGDIPGLGAISFPVAGGGMQDMGGVLGDPRDGGSRVHKGVDIFADYGTPVVSVTSGTVIRIGEIEKGGQRVTVQDSQGNTHYYAHLSGYANGLALNQTIASGTLLGYVGTSGNATGTSPHLHYSINEGSSSRALVDPVQLFENNQIVTVDPSAVGGANETGSHDHVDTGAVDPLADLTDEQALDIVRTDLPFMLGFMEIPELRDIFVRAAQEGRSRDQGWIQSELMQTDWWKERSENQRGLEALKNTDPATYNDQIVSLAKDIRGQYIQLGYAPPGGDPFSNIESSSPLYQQAETYLLTGMTSQEIMQSVTRAAAAGVPFDALDPTPPGQMGNMMSSIQSTASNYMVNVTDEQAYEWAQKIAMGDLTSESITDTIKDMAMSKFAFDENVTNRIRDGFTPQQLFSEHRNVISRTLDMDPDQIDFDDPQFSSVLNGGSTGGSMSVADTRKWIRGSSAGGTSREVQRDGNAVLQSLMETFGVQG